MKTVIVSMSADSIDAEQIEAAAKVIQRGGLVAFPTETVYGLGGNAFDPGAAKKIYAAKGRPSDNPLIVHIAGAEDLFRIAKDVPKEARILAEKLWPGPLTMILNKKEDLPKETTGGLDTVAIRCPSDPVARELIRRSGGFIAAPSANLSGRPSTTRAEHVIRDMDGRVDMIIASDDSRIGLESTIVDLTVSPAAILRPGYYSAQLISELLKETVVSAETAADPDAAPKAPGMKYRHYAPKAELVVITGDREQTVAAINEKIRESQKAGKKAAVICLEETAKRYDCPDVFPLGCAGDEEMIAHRLFDVLRKTDETKADIIYSEAFETPNLGSAIMNRLRKAAGGRIIAADGSPSD